jgi:hypothetical protein
MLPWVRVECPTPTATATATSTPTPENPLIEALISDTGDDFCGGDTSAADSALAELRVERGACLANSAPVTYHCERNYEYNLDRLSCQLSCGEDTACCLLEARRDHCESWDDQCRLTYETRASKCRCDLISNDIERALCYGTVIVFLEGFAQLWQDFAATEFGAWIIAFFAFVIGIFVWYGGYLLQKAAEAWEWMRNAGIDAWEWTSGAVNDAWNWTKDTASKAWKTVKGWFS